MKVVSSMLKAGIPLNKIDGLRDLLEESGYSLSNSTNLKNVALKFVALELTVTCSNLRLYSVGTVTIISNSPPSSQSPSEVSKL